MALKLVQLYTNLLIMKLFLEQSLNLKNFGINFRKLFTNFLPKIDRLSRKGNNSKKIDNWHISKKGKEFNKNEYINFLKSVEYLIEEKYDFKIETSNVDEEISSVAGPQLVVPVDNARYALNAANARWGSLYDALYGTDVIAGKVSNSWDKERAKKVISFVRNFFDERIPLMQTSWSNITKIKIDQKLVLFSILKQTI